MGFVINGFVFTSGQIAIDPATGEDAGRDRGTDRAVCKNVLAIQGSRAPTREDH